MESFAPSLIQRFEKMFKALLFALFFVFQLHEVLARAVPGIHLSGRGSAHQNPAKRFKSRSVAPRDGEKIAPKVLIISMVFNSMVPL